MKRKAEAVDAGQGHKKAKIDASPRNPSSPKAGAKDTAHIGPASGIDVTSTSTDAAKAVQTSGPSKSQVPGKIRKLVPPRPFPTVPPSSSATGPRSAHSEGKNFICITRKTPLGAYLRRCKETIMKDGYKTLHLHALGAAIPHLLTLAVSLPEILPFPSDDVHTEIRTGTVELRDEIIPDDEEEDISVRKRDKSTVSIVVKIGDGDEGDKDGIGQTPAATKTPNGSRKKKGIVESRNNCASEGKEKGRGETTAPEQIIVQEADQEEDDMDQEQPQYLP